MERDRTTTVVVRDADPQRKHSIPGADWRRWRCEPLTTGRSAEAWIVGRVDDRIAHDLKSQHGIELEERGIGWSVRELRHATRPEKTGRGSALRPADLDRVPEILARPKGVLWDTKAPSLLYVADAVDAPGRLAKIVIRPNFRDRLKIGDGPRETVTINSVRTAGYVKPGDLRESRYRPVGGRE